MEKKYKELSLTVTSLSRKGRGICLLQNEQTGKDKKIEIPATLPGEEIIVEVPSGRRRKKKGTLLEVLKPSNDRVDAKCKHFGLCGGCTLQHLKLEAQHKLKEESIQNGFAHLDLTSTNTHPIVPSPAPFHYRNKMEFSFSQNREGKHFLGLMNNQGKSRVENLETCFLTNTWQMDVLRNIRSWWKECELAAYFMPADRGSLLTLTLREGINTGFKLAMLTVSGNPEYALTQTHLDSFKEALYEALPNHENKLTIYLQIRVAKKGVPTQFFEKHIGGPEHLREELHLEIEGEKRTLDLKISPSSFFQPNTNQAENLYSKAIELLNLSGEETVLDLYCGTGTIGLACAPYVKEVNSIEINPYAVCDGEQNRDINALHNLTFHRGDVGKILTEKKLTADVVIVDPPRAGLDQIAVDQIIEINPKKICYISCNPNTQGENLPHFVSAGYSISHVQPVDQFPHTMHIENIVILDR